MNKNYNISRKRLFLPEYGRHIHDMVDSLLEIESREERNRKARYIIGVMGNLQPQLRDSVENAHKLWDHLFIMSDYRLDVDSPYPVPTRESFEFRPARLRYPSSRISMKHYGQNVHNIIKALKETDDPDTVRDVINNLARFMRAKSFEFNQEHPSNEVIIRDLKSMSDNMIEMDEEALTHLRSDYRMASSPQRGRKPQFQKKQARQARTGYVRRGQGRK